MITFVFVFCKLKNLINTAKAQGRKGLIIIIFSCLILQLQAGSFNYHADIYLLPPDTVTPPPPPGGASPLSGPSSACVGETSVYSIDVPVACSCQWTLNGTPLAETGSTLEITWTEAGNHEISVVFVCSGGQSSDAESMTVLVYGIPQPEPITGDELVCEYTYHTYSTIVDPNDSCQWTVNGIIQPGFESSIVYSFGSAGNYHFEVFAFNPCGTSATQEIDVIAQGTAPATPSPIQGLGETCTGNTGIYTTTVGPGESCAWWIDGIPQASTSTTLEVTWIDRGDHIIEVRAVSECGTGNPTFKNVLVLYQPSVFLGNDTTIIQGQTLILDAGNPGSGYLWSTGETTQTITVILTGSYSVDVSNLCGSDADTIEVSVIVGIDEFSGPNDCFILSTKKGKIILTGFPESIDKIQVSSITGHVIYEGRHPNGEVTVINPGIYIIRGISGDYTCCKKVFVP